MLDAKDVCYKSSAILHVDIAQTFDSFEGKRSEFDLETLLGKSLRPISVSYTHLTLPTNREV